MLYLVRHGKAEDGPLDDLRRLTEGGRRAVGRSARRLAAAGVTVDRIGHSGLARARETAEILAEALGSEVEEVAGLRPGDDVVPVAHWLAAAAGEDIMLVGHLPFMERLAAYLLTGDTEVPILHFRTAAIACLSPEGNRWILEWFVPPRLS